VFAQQAERGGDARAFGHGPSIHLLAHRVVLRSRRTARPWAGSQVTSG
jgi:hypothetical protein